MQDSTKEVEDLVAKHKELNSQRSALDGDVKRIEAELESLKRSLKKGMDEVRKEGLDPNNLKEDISRLADVYRLKLTNYETELKEAQNIVRPMVEAIKRG